MLLHMRDGGFVAVTDKLDSARDVPLIIQAIQLICTHSEHSATFSSD
jgi:hypothetical protein